MDKPSIFYHYLSNPTIPRSYLAFDHVKVSDSSYYCTCLITIISTNYNIPYQNNCFGILVIIPIYFNDKVFFNIFLVENSV